MKIKRLLSLILVFTLIFIGLSIESVKAEPADTVNYGLVYNSDIGKLYKVYKEGDTTYKVEVTEADGINYSVSEDNKTITFENLNFKTTYLTGLKNTGKSEAEFAFEGTNTIEIVAPSEYSKDKRIAGIHADQVIKGKNEGSLKIIIQNSPIYVDGIMSEIGLSIKDLTLNLTVKSDISSKAINSAGPLAIENSTINTTHGGLSNDRRSKATGIFGEKITAKDSTINDTMVYPVGGGAFSTNILSKTQIYLQNTKITAKSHLKDTGLISADNYNLDSSSSIEANNEYTETKRGAINLSSGMIDNSYDYYYMENGNLVKAENLDYSTWYVKGNFYRLKIEGTNTSSFTEQYYVSFEPKLDDNISGLYKPGTEVTLKVTKQYQGSGSIKLVKWHSDDVTITNPEDPINAKFTMPSKDVLIHIETSKPSQTLKIYDKDGKQRTESHKGGDEVTVTMEKVTGYKLVDWKISPNIELDTTDIYKPKFTMPNSNVELYSIWEKEVVNEKEIKISNNANDRVRTLSREVGTEVEIKPSTINNFEFVEWEDIGDLNATVSEDGTLKFVMPDREVNIKQKFKVIPGAKFTLKIATSEGVESLVGAGEHVAGSTVNISVVLKENYTFKGWEASSLNPEVVFENPNALETSFIMPAKMTYISANTIRDDKIPVEVIVKNPGVDGTTSIKGAVGTKDTITSGTKEHYEFERFFSDDLEITNLTEPGKARIVLPNKDVSYVYIEWKPKDYKLYLKFGNGESDILDRPYLGKLSEQELYELYLLHEPVTGKKIEGWYKENTFENKWDFENDRIMGETYLYAKLVDGEEEIFKVNVDYVKEKYKGNNKTLNVRKGDLLPNIDIYDTGVTIEGWYTDEAFTSRWDFNDPVTKNMNLYAKWISDSDKDFAIVTFIDGHFMTEIDPVRVKKGEPIPKPADPSVEGWRFMGWYDDDHKKWKFEDSVNNDMTLFAKWINDESATVTETYKVKFNLLGHGSYISNMTVNEGDKIPKPTDPTEEGWEFMGWYTEETLENKWNFDNPITSDLTLYAKWVEEGEEPTPETVTVTLDMKGKGGDQSLEVEKGKAITSLPTPTYTGYKFEGWFADEDLTTPWDIATVVDSDRTLYAKWVEEEKPTETVTVTLDMKGKGENQSLEVEKGKAITSLPTPTYSGYKFEGWFADEDLTTPWDIATVVDSDRTLYAKWVEEEKPTETVTVTLDMKGKGENQSLEVEKGKAITSLPTPTYSGYKFEGWFADEDLTTPWDIATVVDSDRTLYAKWVEEEKPTETVTVTLDMKGKGENQSLEVEKGKAITSLPTPTYTGYKFVGWFADKGLTTPWDISTVIDSNTTLYAKWVKDSKPIKPSVDIPSWLIFGSADKKTIEKPVDKPIIKPSNKFIDVPKDAFFKEAVDWAVEKGITTGTSENTFSPYDTTTRGEMVTFLWRAAGMPEPKTKENPFEDIDENAYYYKALLWAYENDIVKGMSEDEFAPEVVITRGQTATFLYRFGDGLAMGENPFVDVSEDAYYADAVKWAAEEKITTGTSENTFDPEAAVTRGEIVTFLYRQLGK